MKNKFFTILIFTILFSNHLFADGGIIRGTVNDSKTGETIPFVNVYIEELKTGTTTDLDGNYTIKLPEGKYSLKFSFLGYSSHKVENLEIKKGNTEILNILMKEEGQILEEVVIQARQARNTQAALATIKRKSTKLLDGVSSQTFSKVGDSDAADAIKRVTGVSTQDGKYVFVRGLGDRYTKTMLNNMNIPGLDPDKNTVQMDIFPTNIIDNIIVYKSFSPELPADFTGGIVNIATKDFPDRKMTKLSLSLGYNPNVHFNDKFLSYDGGKFDRLGFDDGTRKLPFRESQAIPDVSSNAKLLNNLTNSFSKEMASKQHLSGIDHSVSFSHGNQLNFKSNSLGYILALNYKNGYSHYQDALYESYLVNPVSHDIHKENEKKGVVSTNNILLSGLLSAAYKTKKHKFSIGYMIIQNADDKVADLRITDFDDNPSTIVRDIIQYSQRTVHNIKLAGKHNLKANKFIMNWDFSPTWIEVDEPDIRTAGFEYTDDGKYLINPSIGADINRIFRNLKERTYNGKVDFTYNYKQWSGLESKLSFGINYLHKNRDFGIHNYNFRVKSQGDLNINGNPDNLFSDESLWEPGSDKGIYIKGNFEPANTFEATQKVLASYAMTELPFTSKLKAIFGIRMEQVNNFYTGQNNQGTEIWDYKEVLNDLDILPSVNLIYSITDKINARFSYNKTLARPSFKEKSNSQIQDRISGRTFIGNIDLVGTDIDNIDLRLERFYGNSQMLSLSTFYKRLINPIELESYNELSPDNFTPRNQSEAFVYGLEFEARKDFGFLTKYLNGLFLTVNASYLYSETKRENMLDIYQKDTRQMVGQAPYIINAGMGYSKKGYEVNISYNVQGSKLSIVGIGSIPDVYEMPFHSLDAKASMMLNNNIKMSISASNILASEKVFTYDGGDLGKDTHYWSLLKPGRKFSIAFSYDFNKPLK